MPLSTKGMSEQIKVALQKKSSANSKLRNRFLKEKSKVSRKTYTTQTSVLIF